MEQQEVIITMRTLAEQGMASRAIAAAEHERCGVKVSHVTIRGALACAAMA